MAQILLVIWLILNIGLAVVCNGLHPNRIVNVYHRFSPRLIEMIVKKLASLELGILRMLLTHVRVLLIT
jgi:hypothetical protein